MVLAVLANKDVNAIYGARPMVTDLRTGGMAGGSGEQSLLTAAAVQLAQYYNFPNSTISGATDSKLPDNQAGYEKAINLTLAVQTGANLITQAAGTQAGLMATSLGEYTGFGFFLSSGLLYNSVFRDEFKINSQKTDKSHSLYQLPSYWNIPIILGFSIDIK